MLLTPTLVVVVLSLFGDVIILRNGNEIQGEILKEEDGRLVVKFPGGTLELQQKQIAEVRRQPRVEYLLDEGEKRARRGEHEEAVAAYLEATREDPGSERARKGLLEAREGHADALADLGRYDEAKEALAAVLHSDPGNVEARREVRIIDEILAEARREEERGREEINAGHLEQGIWRLQRLFDRFPGRRKDLSPVLGEAIIAEGDKLLARRDWTGAEVRYLRALSTEPELLPRLRRQFTFVKARRIEPLVAKGDFGPIEKLAQEGLEVDPSSEVLRYFKGMALEAKGEARDAAEEYLAILDVKRPPSLEKAASDLRLQAEAKLVKKGEAAPTSSPHAHEVLPGDFRQLRTDHFAIFHKNTEVAREVAMVAEQSYWQTFRDLGCLTHLRNPIRVHVYPTQDDYVGASGLQSWSGGAHQIARRMGDLSEHRIYSYQGQPRLTTGVLPHEIAHGLLAHRLNYPEQIPLWANEGFAVLREPSHFHQFYRRIIRQEAARQTLLPAKTVIGRTDYPSDRVEVYYGQCFSLTEFLVSLEGLGTFVGFVKDISGSNPSLDSSLRRHYGIAGVTALENRWWSWFESSGASRDH